MKGYNCVNSYHACNKTKFIDYDKSIRPVNYLVDFPDIWAFVSRTWVNSSQRSTEKKCCPGWKCFGRSALYWCHVSISNLYCAYHIRLHRKNTMNSPYRHVYNYQNHVCSQWSLGESSQWRPSMTSEFSGIRLGTYFWRYAHCLASYWPYGLPDSRKVRNSCWSAANSTRRSIVWNGSTRRIRENPETRIPYVDRQDDEWQRPVAWWT